MARLARATPQRSSGLAVSTATASVWQDRGGLCGDGVDRGGRPVDAIGLNFSFSLSLLAGGPWADWALHILFPHQHSLTSPPSNLNPI